MRESNPFGYRTGNYWFIIKDDTGKVLCRNIFTAIQDGDPNPPQERSDSISWEGYGGCSWTQTCYPSGDCIIVGPNSAEGCGGSEQFTIDRQS